MRKTRQVRFASLAVACCLAGTLLTPERTLGAEVPCDFSEALGRERETLIESQAASAEQMLLVIADLERLLDEADLPAERPLTETLTTEQAARFSALTQRQKTMMLWRLIDSRRVRDLDIIEEMTVLADQASRFETVIEEEDPRFIAWGLLGAMERPLEKAKEPADPGAGCQVDWALWEISEAAYRRLSVMNIEDQLSLLEEIKRRYGFSGAIEAARLSEADREKFFKARRELLPSLRQITLMRNMENVRRANRVSEMMHDHDSDDVGRSGGEIEAVGSTITRMAEQGRISDEEVILVFLWRKVNEQVPAPVVQEMEMLSGEGK